jgi:hypothetical protein
VLTGPGALRQAGRVVEPLPRWGKWFLAGVAAVAVAVVVVRALDDGLGAAQPADWQVAPSAELRPTSRHVPVLVRERSCSSGRSAGGRIDANVAYERDVVVIDIGVRPFGGDQDCQGNPSTPFVVELAEPLGDRVVTGERRRVP